MDSTGMSLKILIVDDSEEDRASCRRYLTQGGERTYSFHEAETLEEGVALFQALTPDCVLLDFNLPDGDGLEFAARVREHGEADTFSIILMTGQGSEELVMEAMKNGVTDYLPKRLVNRNSLCRTVLHAIERVVLHRGLKAEQREKDRVIAELQQALAEVRRLSVLLPICAHCKSIRKDDGYWQQVEGYLADHAGTQFSHGICPDCLVKEYGEETARRVMEELARLSAQG